MHRWCILLMILSLGCQARDRDTLATVCKRTGTKVSSAAGGGEQISARWRVLRAAFAEHPAGRVEARLRWDRYLGDAGIEAKAAGKGVVRLRGTIDPGSRQRAVELAQSTAGVERVIDEMKNAQTPAPEEARKPPPGAEDD